MVSGRMQKRAVRIGAAIGFVSEDVQAWLDRARKEGRLSRRGNKGSSAELIEARPAP